MSKKLTTYKGTDKDMKCHGGFQYELGKMYTDDGAIRCGGRGFHSCKAPLDVFRYFAPNKSRYFACLMGGTVDEDTADSKIASSELELKVEIGIPGWLKHTSSTLRLILQRSTLTTNRQPPGPMEPQPPGTAEPQHREGV